MMNATLSSSQYQQQRVSACRSSSDSYRFFNLLTSDTLLDAVEELLPDHRERVFPPTETLALFLEQAMQDDRSCQNIVNKSAIQRISNSLPHCSTHTGGYCRARQRLPLDMVSVLAQKVGRLVEQEQPSAWAWRNRRVYIADGTTLTMPDTPANQHTFPQQRGQQPGLGFPICRLVGITSLQTGALINAAIGRFNGKGGDEQTLMRSIQHTFERGDLVLADAYFTTYFFIADMQKEGVDVLMEQNGARRLSTDFRRGKRLGHTDHLIHIHKPKKRPYWMSEEIYDTAPDSITLREFKAGHKIMVTTLSDSRRFAKAELKVLYQSRWQIELDLRQLKDTLGMNILSCKSPGMVHKEIWVYLLAYNLIRLIMAQSALLADLLPRQLSFKHSLQLWLHVTTYIQPLDDDIVKQLMFLIAQQRVGNRSGRVEPRAVKRRPKAYPLLMQPRSLAREEIRKQGHPRKLK